MLHKRIFNESNVLLFACPVFPFDWIVRVNLENKVFSENQGTFWFLQKVMESQGTFF